MHPEAVEALDDAEPQEQPRGLPRNALLVARMRSVVDDREVY